ALRINTGIEAHTHEYIKTSKHSSKFGESIFDDSAEKAVEEILKNEKMEFIGFHCHIGSQIFDTNAFLEEIKVMVKYTKEISEKFNVIIPEINLGGGFGVYYTEEDVEVDIEAFTREMIICLEKTLEEENLKINKVSIEPGRSIIANAGSTLYTIGGIKTTYSGDKYLFIDGGMSDNMRPALYQAKYEAAIANKMNDEPVEEVTIAGKCCESGDLIVKKGKVSKGAVGDIIITTTTGAYGYSMSNNYNKIERPAVVFVKGGKAQIAIKRETYEELVKNDLEIEI
ncbi:MAG: diaminopimelate decarboxylase family protein, partial [Fusobacteriaceae bacterium]